MDTIDRLPQTGEKGRALKQRLQAKLIEHKQYIDKHGQDLPEIRNWKWGQSATQNAKSAAEKARVPELKLRRTIGSKNGRHNNLTRTKGA